jgi:hypothetical protein
LKSGYAPTKGLEEDTNNVYDWERVDDEKTPVVSGESHPNHQSSTVIILAQQSETGRDFQNDKKQLQVEERTTT